MYLLPENDMVDVDFLPRAQDECPHWDSCWVGHRTDTSSLFMNYPTSDHTLKAVDGLYFHFCPMCGIDLDALKAEMEKEEDE